MKKYLILYGVKMNRTEYGYVLEMEAKNAKEACAKTKEYVFATTGRNAFGPVVCKPEEIGRYIKGLPPHK